MSFRGDDQRRYGQVPPVQYPVASQPADQHGGVGRRPSFNSGDDAAYYGRQGQDRPSSFSHGAQGATEDELFLSSPTTASSSSVGRSPFGSTNSALSGYQHQYQDTTPSTPSSQLSYNPQNFAHSSGAGFQRSQSANLPYHPHPSSRYSNTSVNSYNTSPPANYTPQTYNPAAYANTNVPQRQATYHGYGQEQGYGASVGSGASAAYGQSPGATYSAAFPQPMPSPGLSPGFQQSLPTSPSSFAGSNSQIQTPTYDPSQYAAGQHPIYEAPADSQVSSAAPYPTTSQITVGPNYQNDHASYYTRPSRSDSQTSPRTSPFVQPQSPSGLQRHPTNAPLPSRPMEDVPEEPLWDSNGRPLGSSEYNSERATQESIMEEIEAELGGNGHRSRRRPSPIDGRISDEQAEQLRRYSPATSAHSPSASRVSPSATRRHLECDDDDDDPEGTAGVLAMYQAELEDRRFSGNAFLYGGDAPATTSTNSLPPTHEEPERSSSDSDLGGAVDLGMLSGGYPGNLMYGADIGSPPGSSSMPDGSRPLPTPGYYNSLREGYDNAPAFNNAEMDYGGTGGLQAPRAHRLSFDAGREERVSVHSLPSGTESPTKDEYQDLFYHPGISNRPLPALPPGPGSDSSSMLSVHNSVRSLHQHQHQHSLSADSRYYQADAPEAYYQTDTQPLLQPERSISLSGHSNTPQVQAPARSRTDAAEERKKISRQHQTVPQIGPTFSEYDSAAGSTAGAFDSITLPTGRKKKFVPSKLTSSDFRKCAEPWALSGIEAWVRFMGEGEIDLREKTVEEAVTNLFTSKVPTMNVADAEVLSSQVVKLMLESRTLLPEEEWVKFGEGHISGVLWQLTGSGCYAPKVHDPEISGRCYSHHCTRTLKKVNLDDLLPEDPKGDWNVFYSLKKEDWEAKPKKEVDRQNILHEIVTGEDNYIKQLDIFRTLYRDDLRARNPPIIHPDKRDKFLGAVFGKLDTVLRINKEYLLSQLKYRQNEQGPWIVGFSDIFREWIRKAKSDYIEYATGYPRATYMVRKEADRNILFKKFLEDRQKHKSSSKQDWTHFLIAPLQRLQRYILLLESVEHKMIGDSEEKANLHKAIQEIKTVTHECDAKVAETNKRVQMMELDRMLVLRPGFQSVLNLDHLGRVLIMEGELQRMGFKGMRWVDTHALLFDHYLILAKVVIPKDGKAEKKYDVSREPIPMPLLFLESMTDEAVTKQKGLTAPLGRTTTATALGTQLNKVTSNGSGRPGLEHAATASSMNSLVPTNSGDAEGKILYPFKIKHLGHEVYTLYASSARDRLDWCTSIFEAKTRHAKALFSQNAEPFRLRVLADASFHYDANSMYARASGVPVKGTPLDRAIQDLERVMGPAHGITPVCRAQVNCATGFSAFGKSVIAIGTDYGVFVSDPSEPRGWHRTVQTTRVTQIAVLEEFSVCLIIADKSLISYPLDVIAPLSDFAPPISDNPRRAPQRLAKDVTYFATARMKDRMLVFYKRKEGLHTSFKVLEPIFHKATEKKTRLFGGRRSAAASTDIFRDFDEFYLPTECFSLSLFQSYIAVSTSKGIEMLTLDKKHPMSIPDLKAPSIANIAGRIQNQRPLGMFRLNENEFILTYEDCAVYVDKHGDVSRALIMEYTGKQKKAKGATMYGQYLLLFNDDYVEVRNAENGRLRQIIAGRDVRVIDFGIRGPTGGNAAQSQQTYGQNGKLQTAGETSKGTVKIAMCNPELPGRQVVLEMLLNDGHAE
ncbi:Rho1 guanine nucleotide exchange factor 3 [Tolypocladium ophioglossoides CBS 100239]|uniref:Rho1 guanine nucleotide exchange factor 3 n=1 Tax=Tolypocladium ophioglossoides (strain CBS 100239) TaxID=1163406 RepID=A0A0L0N6U6_TOLOC|nr:Rho1 guanine nucleotide exchange factor 3 [Tolypocladium ophioglossoides CBS 100239]